MKLIKNCIVRVVEDEQRVKDMLSDGWAPAEDPDAKSDKKRGRGEKPEKPDSGEGKDLTKE